MGWMDGWVDGCTMVDEMADGGLVPFQASRQSCAAQRSAVQPVQRAAVRAGPQLSLP